ncbi:dihydroxyacetone kinase [Leifsonia xyli subsp. xyli]|uniref:Dihydroxyacetone kinase n=2 Tax=Leifsonia xyli subsp. xyli TaxID=59736 RepID=Q6AFI5_LEIXX|nr:dihydroxyacetone kinase subunit DhaL [Leifsonia xyli]AAT88860.1 dihydroxyacetone kinase [Leifsonia xyli subsp. xyli str. CTCB07]ODA90110.1 dihydroxyacetone kinase [Leifsonia xyli subsp. xyli]
MTLDTKWVEAWIGAAAASIGERKAELNTLDREIGDGDHGENMDRGVRAALEALRKLPDDATPNAALRSVAMTLISTVGGASGPLYGTAFLKAAEPVVDQAAIDGETLVALLTAARDGILSRGRAEPGDKTMIDAWTPAVDAAAAAQAAGESPSAILAAAADAAEKGAEATEPLVARKGRASYLGGRSTGHRDPGAQSTALILRAASETAA